ncbi:MAG: AI-2E family transporter [Anaplasma sp.]
MKYINCLIGVFCAAALVLVMRPVLSPCCIAAVLAYLLNPLVNKLESIGLPRVISSFVIVFSFVAVFATFLVFLTPVAYSQALEMVKLLADKLPFLNVEKVKDLLQAYDLHYDDVVDAVSAAASLPDDLFKGDSAAFLKLLHGLYKNFGKVVMAVVHSGVGLGSLLIKILLTLMLSFYILESWPLLVKNVLSMVPKRHVVTFSECMSKMDSKVSAYIRGQTTICLILSLYYCICFLAVGLKYSLVMGFMSGIMSFVPYLGPILCTALGIGMAILQGMSWTSTVAVILIFAVGHAVESQVITPVLIGRNLNLNPGWLVVGVVVFSAHAGLLGALVAVPVTAMVSVLAQLAMERYTRSNFYLGR